MTHGKVSGAVLADRLARIERMLAAIRRLPLADHEAFFADERNIWTAESCLRRALEALLDIGRHVLAKRFALAVTEYKHIARELGRHGVLSHDDAARLETLAGYRNRMVHFYHDVTPEELFTICDQHLGDVETIAAACRRWAQDDADRIDDGGIELPADS